jgi:uroporphyrinogen-III synthase
VGAAASSRSIENRTPALADAERIWALLQEGLLDCLSSTSPSTLVNVSEAMGSRHVADGVQVAAS